MTSNAFEPSTHTLRTYLGSGNRERMMDQAAACGADNLMGCCRAGCTVVTATESDNYGACTDTTSFSCSGGVYSLPASSTTCGTGAAVCGSGGANFTASTTLHFECPGAGTLADSVGTATCTSAGSCSVTPVGTRSISGTFTAPPKNRFYGIWSYGRVDRKMFTTAAQAETFDASRFTDIAYSGTCTGTAATSCALVDTTGATVTYTGSNSTPSLQATADDPGWFYEYGRVCPLKDCSANPPPWTDEKTGSGSTVVLGCAAWGGFRPYGVATTTDPCSGSLGTPVTYGYIANYISGVPTVSCGYADSGIVYRAVPRSTTAPPSASTVRVTLSPSGQVAYSTLQVDAGSAPGSKTMGVRSEIGEPVYWLEVSRQMHQCRHVNPAMCN
jgi:type IV pilus assembly protein PilY1